jgi:DNA-binding NarL/FixJ family response regulator
MKVNVNIVIADDHPVYRKGLIQVIREEIENFKIVGEAANGSEALKMIIELKPEIAVLDIDMPLKNGFEVVREVNNLNGASRFIFLTMYKEEKIFDEALSLGAMGYLVKDSALNEISECLQTVYQGDYYISPSISGYLVNRLKKRDGMKSKQPSVNDLSITERKVIKMIAENKTSNEIAEILFISRRTVEKHRSNISEKLNLKGSYSLIKFAIENKNLL